jgi:photosystem II stability/assembly factor-like uncharacterized protein
VIRIDDGVGMGDAKVRVLVGTKRGLFVARSDRGRSDWKISEPRLAGREVFHTLFDETNGVLWASTRHAVWGVHIHYSRDLGETWDVLPSTPHHDDGAGVSAVWCVVPGTLLDRPVLFAGIEPAGLFWSEDGGKTWRASSLNARGAADGWQPAGGSLALHSIVADPHQAGRIWCAVSAGGVYRSDDHGSTWHPKNGGTRADFLPQRFPESGQCVHKLIAHPAKANRLYQQNHCGTYRTDDGGESWTEITAGLPSDFGYVLATDPRDADILFVIPEESSHMRTTAGGRLRVYRTVDAGSTWQACTRGLPQQDVYVSLLREAMNSDGLDPLGVYFGTSGGHLFASRDGGESWNLVAGYLPRVLSVSTAITAD